ncbi:hypothetical protein N7462_010905 [Penicillium macrosclerotiorum]|uniref:uncharacterized protein n=1 Tax=Penicillium macrosclerotiorum TaxID=303699 RepID=UPI0025497BA4|nr:uncharacterized protein N7462_010905 [Penicillium macrosclerotiorum]KAJ5669835.1 hypothetical protein N7462_010905 [Penicillium macrosclerotiorum]
MEPHGQNSPAPSQAAVESVTNFYDAVKREFPDAVKDFESRWAAWHEEDLQLQARQIVGLNYERNKLTAEHIQGWKAHQEEHMTSSSAAQLTGGEGCANLRAMGPSITAHIMLAWVEFDLAFWDQLLYPIYHGKAMGSWCWQPSAVQAEWLTFFNEGELDQVPVYILSDFDRMMNAPYPDDVGK